MADPEKKPKPDEKLPLPMPEPPPRVLERMETLSPLETLEDLTAKEKKQGSASAAREDYAANKAAARKRRLGKLPSPEFSTADAGEVHGNVIPPGFPAGPDVSSTQGGQDRMVGESATKIAEIHKMMEEVLVIVKELKEAKDKPATFS